VTLCEGRACNFPIKRDIWTSGLSNAQRIWAGLNKTVIEHNDHTCVLYHEPFHQKATRNGSKASWRLRVLFSASLKTEQTS
jgi:hypothetical protein